MANILLIDDSDVAGLAFGGIVARGHHRCHVVSSVEEAWRILREAVVFDLVVLELKVPDAMGFLQRVREDWFWKVLPVIVYTRDTDAKQVRKALGLKVQNYLIKPYADEAIFAELAKVQANPWRNLHFEEPRSFCAQLGMTSETLAKMRRDVMAAFQTAAQNWPEWADRRENEDVFAQINALTSDAESAGVWAGVDYLRYLLAEARRANWTAFRTCGEYLEYASRLVFSQLNPAFLPDCLRTPAEVQAAAETAARARWEHVDVDRSGPVLGAEEIAREVGELPGCPVVDVEAAGFQMAADGRATSITRIMDLVSVDPGLCAQMLAAANKAERDKLEAVEDPRAAVTILGELRLQALARSLPVAAARHMEVLPLSWTAFRLFQNSVGRVAEFICAYLEFNYLEGNARTAGLLHDLGKLLVVKLHPFGFQAIVRYARERRLPLHTAERKFLGCTSRDLAVRFVEKQGLPPIYTNVIRWVESPLAATEHADLVAMVALARHVCLHNHVGHCGDTPADVSPSLGQTEAWQALQPRLFPSFDLRKFEAQAHAFCQTLKQEVIGRRRSPDALVA